MEIKEEIIVKRYIEYDSKRFYEDSFGYWICREGKKFSRLHRYLYEKEVGKIPYGYDVHHIDFDRSNNELSNFKIINKKEHLQFHANTIEAKKRSRKNMEIAREYAIQWHKSKEGIEWHKSHFENTLKKSFDKKIKKVCEICGKEYEVSSHIKNSKFCSKNCKSKNRRLIGTDNITRTCCICGNSFVTNKYSKSKTCSRKCRQLIKKE